MLDLDTPVGRRAVEAAMREFYDPLLPPSSSPYWEQNWEAMARFVQAALDVLQSDVCQTCDGEPTIPGSGSGPINVCENPDCVNGKVKAAIPTWGSDEQQLAYRLLSMPATARFGVAKRLGILDQHRAEITRELIGALTDAFKYSSNAIEAFAADFIARRENVSVLTDEDLERIAAVLRRPNMETSDAMHVEHDIDILRKIEGRC